MRFSHLMTTFVVGSGLVLAVLAFAQGPGGVQPQGVPAQAASKDVTSVAVVDVKYLFDNMHGFKIAMDRIKQENDQFEAQVREQQVTLTKQFEELKALTPGSDQFKALEEKISHTKTQVQLDIQRRQKQRVEDEAKLYHRAYQDVERTIAGIAQRYGFDLVLQHSTAEIDPSKPDTVIRGLNRLILYQRGRDISKFVLEELNRAAPAPAAPAVTAPNRPNTGVAPRTAFPPSSPTNPGSMRK